MCTVVIDVSLPTRVLAVRDEDPQREWDDLGPWWPEQYPGVTGIRDRRAGGAWLAVDQQQRRLAVLLNRADVLDLPPEDIASRGSLALESVAGRSPSAPLPMHGFNLLEVDAGHARVLSWDGATLRETPVPAGVHMVAHDDLDDPATARIGAWLPAFRAAAGADDEELDRWIGVLAESASLDKDDDRAIIRDNHVHGYPTMSLLYVVAEISDGAAHVRSHVLARPAEWP